MLLSEHNYYWTDNETESNIVNCTTLGYGKLSHYDSDCAACYVKKEHTWSEHDRHIIANRVKKYGFEQIFPQIDENKFEFWKLVQDMDTLSSEEFVNMLMHCEINKTQDFIVARAWHKEFKPINMDEWIVFDENEFYHLYNSRYASNEFLIRSMLNNRERVGHGYPIMVYYDRLTGFESGSWKTRYTDKK